MKSSHPKKRGRRESRVPIAPAVSRAKMKKHTSVVTTGSPDQSGLPCAMVLTAYFALSPVTGLSCHRRLAETSAKLDASVGASGPHDFAVRFKHDSSSALPRPPHPALYVRDDREPPLFRARDGGGCRSDLGQERTEIFLRKGLDRPNQVDGPQEFGLAAPGSVGLEAGNF
jgi:hypothetical protein